jgi:hypothetical protein
LLPILRLPLPSRRHQVLVQDVPLESYRGMGRFLDHFRPQACILMVSACERAGVV